MDGSAMKANDEGARPFTDAEKGETEKMLGFSTGCKLQFHDFAAFYISKNGG